jgi:hypothetical protein
MPSEVAAAAASTSCTSSPEPPGAGSSLAALVFMATMRYLVLVNDVTVI